MIPKIIHYCWIGTPTASEIIKKSIKSWECLSDYKIVLWDEDRVHALNIRWCEEAILAKKYAFVADYIRFYALFHYGGIYLDTDVEVLKPFDDLLRLDYFVGSENACCEWESGIIGAVKGIQWIGKCLEYYNGRAFINCFGEMQTHILPFIMSNIISKNYIVKPIDNISEWIPDANYVCRFPWHWFSPKNHKTERIEIGENTYCIHHFSKTWQVNKTNFYPLTFSQYVLSYVKKFVRAMKKFVIVVEV